MERIETTRLASSLFFVSLSYIHVLIYISSEMIREADKDGDGRISFAEFKEKILVSGFFSRNSRLGSLIHFYIPHFIIQIVGRLIGAL